jgi:methionyl aminopeptidase
MILKSAKEIEILREGGKRLAFVLKEVAKIVKPGISTLELDKYGEKLIREMGDRPAFLGYQPEEAARPYPASLCISVNDEVVHGIPKKSKILKEGDIVSIDCGLCHKGLYTDSAITVPVGKIDRKAEKLLKATEGALYAGIDAIKPGGHIGDIGYAVENFVKPHKFGIVRILAGHGVGKCIHEDPYVPNYGRKGTGGKLVPGMVIAIEPMLNEGGDDVILDRDGYTYRTADRKRSAHFEHTVAITQKGAEILTQI